jgi:hypothetical protein
MGTISIQRLHCFEMIIANIMFTLDCNSNFNLDKIIWLQCFMVWPYFQFGQYVFDRLHLVHRQQLYSKLRVY